jgi:hypothetical protein
MKSGRFTPPALVLGLALATAGCVSSVKTPGGGDAALAAADRRDLAEASVGQWSDVSSLAARKLMEEYGVPDEIRFGRLVWNGRGPWKRIVVRDVRPAYVEGDDLGVVEQTVDYALTPEQENSLGVFAGRLAYNARTAELSSRADREELNFLRLNLADDVVRGREDARRARDNFAALVSLEESGKASPYMTGLRFRPGL